jgi:FG-GAP repeat
MSGPIKLNRSEEFNTNRARCVADANCMETIMKSIRWQTLLIALVAITFSVFTLTAHAQWTQTATLTASDGQSGDTFSRPMAIDGNTLVLEQLPLY